MQMSDRIGRRIRLQDLHIFTEVVQAGSMGRAAVSLNTSQPNISKSIADLEHALGVRLLDRHRQGIEPTDYGRALLDGGMAVFDELRQTIGSAASTRWRPASSPPSSISCRDATRASPSILSRRRPRRCIASFTIGIWTC
jgi:DNA-binding transcriptional LysR family regulator